MSGSAGVPGQASQEVSLSLEVNRTPWTGTVPARMLLVHLIRDRVGLTGTNIGCDTSNCGACTLLLDGQSVKSCTVLAVQAEGSEITTIEGVGSEPDRLHPLQAAFRDKHALQCGYCTPGMIMSGLDLLKRCPRPSAGQVRSGLEGNTCRCTGYESIVEAVLAAADDLADQAMDADSRMEDAP